jgi:hypothetical protein
MSWSEIPPGTETEQLHHKLDQLKAVQEAQTEAINGLGANTQWIVENVKGIFEMFGSPAFLSMMPAMMAGMGGGPSAPED